MLLVVAVTIIVALALVAALALGWSSPRPSAPPNWESSALPSSIDVSSDTPSVVLLGPRGTDFTFEVTAIPLQGPSAGLYEYGLVYRAQDAGRYYAFVVGADGYYGVFRVEDADLIPLVAWEQFPHVARGQQVNRLLVTCDGSACTFRINDEYAATIGDHQWLAGELGLWARSPMDEGAVRFLTARLWWSDE